MLISTPIRTRMNGWSERWVFCYRSYGFKGRAGILLSVTTLKRLAKGEDAAGLISVLLPL